MKLPVMPPVSPMLAKLTREIPSKGEWIFEPKWDGFRSILFKDGDEVEFGSRNERPLTRYFPELADSVRKILPDKCVLDGEIVITSDEGLAFDTLQQRIHPAESRIKKLSIETPASFVAFDLLALDKKDFRDEPFEERRRLLETLPSIRPPIHITPATRDRDLAEKWFDDFEGAGLDGLVAKSPELTYQPDKRVMLKIKHERTADCVVAGFRWHKTGPIIGSLLLGLFDDDGVLHHVGITSSFTMARRKDLVNEIEPYRKNALKDHPWRGWAEAGAEMSGQRQPGAVSRWNAKKDLSWEPLRPELVCEVRYDHLQGDRFRHATTFMRWRPDRTPESCTYSQLDTAIPSTLASVFSS